MIHLIASYPKSGNTMVRIFLMRYIMGVNNLNHLGIPTFGSRLYFPERMPDDRRIARPAVADTEADKMNFAKTHEIAPLFYPSQGIASAVYLTRNPLDVAPSWAHHTATDISNGVASLSKRMVLKSTSRQYPQAVGTWSENVTGWLTAARFPVRAWRYESLISNPRIHFAEILEWLKISLEEPRFTETLDFIKFENLKKIEKETGFREARKNNFFREGKAGSYHDLLSPFQIRKICAEHGEAMKLCGYL